MVPKKQSPTPKVFISYSWSSQEHQEQIRQWVDRLINDGVEAVFDLYDLKEGNDKYAFMEQMVTDEHVTHVLVFCDGKYVEKANKRKSGVGTESQIISKEVYEKVDQSKFIPMVCEFSEDGKPMLPVFLQSRIWIDFSTLEAVNENWERLIRHLYGKPLYQKPMLGEIPHYIREESSAPSDPVLGKFNTLNQAIISGKKGLPHYRKAFLDACMQYADSLRIRERPNLEKLGEKVLEDCGKLRSIRDHLINWVLLESDIAMSEEFSDVLIEVLEQLLEMKYHPAEITGWNDSWFEAHGLFVYETFLYIIAALIKTKGYQCLHDIYTSQYILPETERQSENPFVKFDKFYEYSEILNPVLAPEGKTLFSPAAELIQRQAQRDDISFQDIIQADLLSFLMCLIIPKTRWFPQTIYYVKYSHVFPLFLRASQHRHFKNLSIITGIKSADELRKKAEEGYERLNVMNWGLHRYDGSLWRDLNLDKLDSE